MRWPLPSKIKWILLEKSAATAAMNYWQVCEGRAFFAIRCFHVVFVCAPQWSDVVVIVRPVTPMPSATTHPSRFAADASRVSMATEESASVSYHPCWFHHRERKLPNNTINDTKKFLCLSFKFHLHIWRNSAFSYPTVVMSHSRKNLTLNPIQSPAVPSPTRPVAARGVLPQMLRHGPSQHFAKFTPVTIKR